MELDTIRWTTFAFMAATVILAGLGLSVGLHMGALDGGGVADGTRHFVH